MSAISRSDLHGMMIETARAPEVRLPEGEPLTMTRNFVWVIGACGLVLATIPLLAGWVASLFLR